jgi:predicted HTH transcriptional regulator
MIESSRDIKALIQQGEGLTLEYKREVSSPHKIAKLITAFSNSRGGKILIGVSDQGVITGVSNINLQKQYIISAAKDFCDPPVSPQIETVSLDGGKILIVTIRESRRKPHRWVKNNEKIETYIRVKDKNYIASEPIIRDLQERSRVREKSLGRSEVNKEGFIISHLRDHERITVKELSEMLNISKRRALRILVALRKKGKILLHATGKQEFYTLA